MEEAEPVIRSVLPSANVPTPELSKGLELDLVVLIDPDAFGDGMEGSVDRYVAMTRATQRLVILTSP
jgi:DNA helicase IV